jgi:hypothetical protein
MEKRKPQKAKINKHFLVAVGMGKNMSQKNEKK